MEYAWESFDWQLMSSIDIYSITSNYILTKKKTTTHRLNKVGSNICQIIPCSKNLGGVPLAARLELEGVGVDGGLGAILAA